MQDGSPLRRGSPSAHVVFGAAQTINSATFQYVQSVAELRQLTNPSCLDIFIDETRNLFAGQASDLSWTRDMQCPSVAQYLQMVDGSEFPADLPLNIPLSCAVPRQSYCYLPKYDLI